MIISFKIKQIRKKQKLTLKHLAIKTGISTSQLSDIENNNKMPSFIYIVLISRALKININDLYKIEKY